MIEVQIDSHKTHHIHTFEVPIKFTREQLEEMLRQIDGQVASEGSSAWPASAQDMAVRKAADLIEITKRRVRLTSLANLFADPAWFILLDLFVRQHSGLQTSVSSACHASFSPLTTALRHIAVLTERNVIRRQYDPVDQRRVFLVLTEEAAAEIQRILLADSHRDLAMA